MRLVVLALSAILTGCAAAGASVVGNRAIMAHDGSPVTILCRDARWHVGSDLSEAFFWNQSTERDIEAWVDKAQCLAPACGERKTNLNMCVLLVGDQFVRMLIDRR